jgi:hypothetical protein
VKVGVRVLEAATRVIASLLQLGQARLNSDQARLAHHIEKESASLALASEQGLSKPPIGSTRPVAVPIQHAKLCDVMAKTMLTVVAPATAQPPDLLH